MLKGQNRWARERVIEDRSSPPIPIQQVAQTVWMISGANLPSWYRGGASVRSSAVVWQESWLTAYPTNQDIGITRNPMRQQISQKPSPWKIDQYSSLILAGKQLLSWIILILGDNPNPDTKRTTQDAPKIQIPTPKKKAVRTNWKTSNTRFINDTDFIEEKFWK